MRTKLGSHGRKLTGAAGGLDQVVAHGEAFGAVVARHRQSTRNAQRRPPDRRHLLVLECEQTGRGMAEPADAGLELGDAMFWPPGRELVALRLQLADQLDELGIAASSGRRGPEL